MGGSRGGTRRGEARLPTNHSGPMNCSGPCTGPSPQTMKMAGFLSHGICFPKGTLIRFGFIFWFCFPFCIKQEGHIVSKPSAHPSREPMELLRLLEEAWCAWNSPCPALPRPALSSLAAPYQARLPGTPYPEGSRQPPTPVQAVTPSMCSWGSYCPHETSDQHPQQEIGWQVS